MEFSPAQTTLDVWFVLLHNVGRNDTQKRTPAGRAISRVPALIKKLAGGIGYKSSIHTRHLPLLVPMLAQCQ